MAIDTVLLLFLLILPTSFTTTTTSPSHFHDFNVEETIAGTKLKPAQIPKQSDHVEESEWENGKWKVKLLHRDKISSTFHDHSTRFNARMKRDVKRVTSLISRINTNSEEEAFGFGFGSDVVSGTGQGSGEYFVRIGLGSPPTYQYMVIDSGSDIVWVQCQPCNQCYNQSDPLFNPANSTSYIGVSCGEAVCGDLDNAGCNEGRCRYEVSYGDGSYTKGTLALETITFGRTVVRDTAIGCGHLNQGMFVGAAGLLGLGGGPMSFVGQLGGQTGGAFGYCLVSRVSASSGSLEFGRDAMPTGAVWVPLIPNPTFPSFYYVGISGLGVGGSRVQISEDSFRITDIGDGGVVMDTGTAVTRLPTMVYNVFRDAFIAQTTNLPRAFGVSIFDTCYDLNGFVSVRVPTVSFYFSGGQMLTLPAKNYLIPVDEVGTFCFAFAPSPSRLSIIGNIQQEGIQISVDVANGFVGFGPNVLKFNLTESGLLCVLPWLTMPVFANIGGWIADTLVSKGLSKTTVRKIMQSIGFLGPYFFLTQLSNVRTPAMAELCMACSQGSDAFSQSGLYSNHQDIGPRNAGVLLGLSNIAGVLAGVFGTSATGYILQRGESSWNDEFKVSVAHRHCT